VAEAIASTTPATSFSAGNDDSRLVGQDHRLDAIAQSELGEDPADVGL
jgi:hypothetical protein